MERWSIYIDIEGFSEIYQTNKVNALVSLGMLAKYLYKIGNLKYPKEGDRLFIHQLGDGFVIVSDFPEKTLERPISIAIVLMQLILINRGVARAGISHGGFADILGCYPDEIRDNLDDFGTLRIGAGLMTIFQVMGDALINSHRLIHKSPKGPCLFVDPELRDFLPKGGLSLIKSDNNSLEVDWIHSNVPIIEQIFSAIGEEALTPNTLEMLLKLYIESNFHQLSNEWVSNAKALLGSQG